MKPVANARKYDVAVIGEINADLILKGNVTPVFGQVEQVIGDADLVMGSSAVIFACGVARLGLKIAFIGKVGDDLFGKFMLDSMTSRGIDISGVIMDKKIRTGFSVILSEGNDRAILTYPGSIPELQYSDINMNLLVECRHLHLSSFFLLDQLRPLVPTVFQKVKEMGLSISLDTNYDPREEWNGGLAEAIPMVDLFLPNETEALAISGKKDTESALNGLQQSVDCVAIKLGAEGAVAKRGDQPGIMVRAFPVEVVDTVGAGDSFDAGFIYGYLNNWDLERNLKFATACGSLSTLSAGGTTGQPTLERAMSFINTYREGIRTK